MKNYLYKYLLKKFNKNAGSIRIGGIEFPVKTNIFLDKDIILESPKRVRNGNAEQ